MKPAALKKLTATQGARLSEIQLLGSRIRERSRDTLNASIVRARLDAINATWGEARKTHLEIIAHNEAQTDPYVRDGVFANLQTTYEDTLDFLLTRAAEFERESDVFAHTTVIDNNQGSGPRSAKLPKLDLPSFSGKFEDWESFRDLFTALVHNAPGLDDSTKLQYLKTCLTGPAADLVKDVTTTSANYASTWAALRSRFYNPRLTVSTHLNALMDLPHLKRESAFQIRAFADESQRIVRALKNLKMPVEHWDVWLVHLLSARIDTDSRKLWEAELSAKERVITVNAAAESDDSDLVSRFPTFGEFSAFLEKRAHALGMIDADPNKADRKTMPLNRAFPGSRKVYHANPSRPLKTSASKCPLCSGIHSLAKCPSFTAKQTYERRLEIRRMRLCFNCFGRHNYRDCTSKGRCAKCRDKHHTLLHFETKARPQQNPSPPDHKPREEKKEGGGASGIHIHTVNSENSKHSVLLATAQVIIVGPRGIRTRARALLDQGSEGCFVTEAVAQLIGLKRERVDIPLSVVGGSTAGRARSRSSFTICSRLDAKFKLHAEALVLPRLTAKLPARNVLELDLHQFEGIALADPQLHIRDSVDIILGADVYGQILLSGIRRFPPSQLIAQNTALGWVVSGSTLITPLRRADSRSRSPLRVLHSVTAEDELSDALQRFWTLEEIPDNKSILKPENEWCEKQFVETHRRAADGRYEIRLPIKGDLPNVGEETRRMASGALKNMYRRFESNKSLAIKYRAFMEEYERLGHMSRVPDGERNNQHAWYLPHHAVVTSDKIRVVFDASRRTRERCCLNDFLFSGPPLQKDLSLILLNWRRYKYVFTADIVKMFRQIRVAPCDRDLQRILWAPSDGESPVEYRLNTVTYGTTCAPFLAIRTLIQLARDEQHNLPLGARCLETNTYVDDTFAGADDIPTANRKRQELINILETAGIELNKWAANHSEILPEHLRENADAPPISIVDDDSVKTLGVYWDPTADAFNFRDFGIADPSETVTKRSILLNIARLFDPLGWLSPVTIIAKVLMQDLWILKCDWDSPLPVDMRERWNSYGKSLTRLPTLSINRWLGTYTGQECELHGFSDASSRAYAAAVYLRVPEENGRFRVSLLAAKTKVAPVKTISVPNLELCGATLLTKLVRQLQSLDFLKRYRIYLWTDSEIVLKWLSRHPCYWKTFVANRVSKIQTELPSANWSYVSTKENPADVATRGAYPCDLHNLNLWWRGPAWLSLSADSWPQQVKAVQVTHISTGAKEPDIFSRFSSLTRLIRIVAYCVRPLINLRRRKEGKSPFLTFLCADELTDSRTRLIRLAQSYAFATEIEMLRHGRALPKNSSISKLNAVLGEEDSLLRVGGRLSNSALSYNRKHPPILSRHSTLSLLFVRHAHALALHGGPTLTSNILMQQVWIIGRN